MTPEHVRRRRTAWFAAGLFGALLPVNVLLTYAAVVDLLGPVEAEPLLPLVVLVCLSANTVGGIVAWSVALYGRGWWRGESS